MENVNKQLLDALKEMVSIVEIHSEATNNNFAWAELSYANEAIAAADLAQQAKPVARDVLMKFGHDVYDMTFWACRDGDGSIDLPAIVDRYAAQPPAVAVPDGYALVPIDPTSKMLMAADRVIWADADILGNYCNLWNAMLAAAEQPK